MMNQSLFLLALAGLAVSAEGQIGDFRWGRWLLDPAAPLPQAMPLDPTQAENATLLSGNAQAGTLSLLGWQGTNQAGTISFSGNAFLAPPGTTWWIGAPQWDIQRGTRNATTGQWTYARRMFQDWRIHMGYCARPAAQLSAAHGSPSRIGHNSLGVDAIVLELDGRWTSNTATGWTTSYYRGNPPNCGVWNVPAGQSINSAQANLANRLADVTSAFAGFTPGNGLWAVDFRVGANGSWTLAIDKNGDQTAEVTVASSDSGRLPSPFSSITGQSGLMLSVEASAANGLGQVGRTPMAVSYRRISATPIQTVPVLTWATPAAITYGTVLSAAQLNATASTAGSFKYTPTAGTILPAGDQVLSVTFAPTDTVNYLPATATVIQHVDKATPSISWSTPMAITYGTPLSDVQLNATASTAGSFAYTPVAGTIMNAGDQVLEVTFAPTDSVNYKPAHETVIQHIDKATPVVNWSTPMPISYGTALGDAQLNATSSIAGSFIYTPTAGAILNAGDRLLSVAFAPTDIVNYKPTTAIVTIQIIGAGGFIPSSVMIPAIPFSVDKWNHDQQYRQEYLDNPRPGRIWDVQTGGPNISLETPLRMHADENGAAQIKISGMPGMPINAILLDAGEITNGKSKKFGAWMADEEGRVVITVHITGKTRAIISSPLCCNLLMPTILQGDNQ